MEFQNIMGGEFVLCPSNQTPSSLQTTKTSTSSTGPYEPHARCLEINKKTKEKDG
ncbi:hypothetical protein BB560_006735, partial [Smittium megazygosporum]